MKLDEEQLKFYLNQIFRLHEGYIEFRVIKGSEVKCKFFKSPCNPEQPIDFIKKLDGKWNIYTGVNLRALRKSKERYLKCVNALFADIDFKDFDNGESEARQVVENFPLTPSLTVCSGNGLHVYYKLSKPFSIESRGDIQEAKKVSYKLHNELLADSTFDISRVLRCVGTMNVKDPDNPKLCSVDSFSFNTYNFRQLQDVLPDGEIDLNQGADLDLSTESEIDSWADIEQEVPKYVIERAKNRPERFDDDRSANDYHIAIRLFEHGLNDQEVKDCFKIFALNDFDAGLKFKEDGEKYMNHTIASAKDEYDRRKEKYNSIDSIEIIEE